MARGVQYSSEAIELVRWIRDHPHHEAGFCNRRGYLPKLAEDETHFFLRGGEKKIVPLAVWREICPMIEQADYERAGRMWTLNKRGRVALIRHAKRMEKNAAA